MSLPKKYYPKLRSFDEATEIIKIQVQKQKEKVISVCTGMEQYERFKLKKGGQNDVEYNYH